MICIFGASVTQQKKGYATFIKNHSDEEVRIFGYGGMHLNDAAICFVDNVLKDKPSYCLFDWFSTGYNITDHKTIMYIDVLINKCVEIECIPFFLFFAFKDSPEKVLFYEYCKKLLDQRGVHYLDINLGLNLEKKNKILRDHIHTTPYGSEFYYKFIEKKFLRTKNILNLPKKIDISKYHKIKNIIIKKEFYESIFLTGKCEIVGFLLTVGPFSGLVEIIDKDNKCFIFNTWDRWCHFTRHSFNLNFEVKENIKVKILQDSIDTSTNTIYQFPKNNKKLVIHKIYYIGDSLKVTNLNAGKRINHLYLWILKINGRLLQFKKKFFYKL